MPINRIGWKVAVVLLVLARFACAAVPAKHAHEHGHGHEHHGGDHGGPHQTVLEERHGVGSSPEAGGFLHFLGWLGKFHPPLVNFPIGVIVAAAVAEVLYLRRGDVIFDAAGRYCVWFGVVAACCAGVLGWLLAGFRFADEDWVMTTHRWLGTSTVLLSIIVLVRSERCRLPSAVGRRRRFRRALFLLATLVLVTGFFGGAMAYGLNHYSWP